MLYFDWSPDKNEWLKREREVCFEDVKAALEDGRLIAVIPNPNTVRYPAQKEFLVEINGYVYVVPFVEDEEKIFFKTIIPSRKATKKYLRGKKTS